MEGNHLTTHRWMSGYFGRRAMAPNGHSHGAHGASRAGRSLQPEGAWTILFVDDEELIRDLVRVILEQAGYEVLTASNGVEALVIYGRERGRISLVVLDLIMPEMGGMRCLEELLIMDPGVKVLMVSGSPVDVRTEQAIECYSRGFLSKPFSMGKILKVVRDILDAEAGLSIDWLAPVPKQKDATRNGQDC